MKSPWTVAGLAALGLAVAACGAATQPYCPSRSFKAEAVRTDTDARRTPLPERTSWDTSLPPLDGLSDAGRLALKVLLETEQFTGAEVGEGRDTPVEVEAWRVLLRERDGGAAFRYLVLAGGGTPAALFGLCGLWHTDRPLFDAALAEARAGCGDATIPMFDGCLRGEQPMSALLARIEDGTLPGAFRGGP